MLKKLRSKVGEYSDRHRLRVRACSWNVNGKKPTESLRRWLWEDDVTSHAAESAMLPPTDVFAVAIQELDLSAEAFLLNDSARVEDWAGFILEELPGGSEAYGKVAVKQMVGVTLAVFARLELFEAKAISNVSVAQVATGIMGVMGNKGGVGVSLDLHMTSVCFVNTHLAAGQEKVTRRNADFHEVLTRLKFADDALPMPGFAANAAGATRCVLDHDVIVWLGDLNYRIDNDHSHVAKAEAEAGAPGAPGRKDGIDIRALAAAGRFGQLYVHDQLRQQRQQGLAFQDFEEGPIEFGPTYKFDAGTDTFDTSEKQRTPAWTDRILWHRKSPLQLVRYASHPTLMMSDHKPVSATLDVTVAELIMDRYGRLRPSVHARLRPLTPARNGRLCTLQTPLMHSLGGFVRAGFVAGMSAKKLKDLSLS